MTLPVAGREPGVKQALLRMVGGGARLPLGPEEWLALDAMVAQHRLGPLLAWRAEQGQIGPIPGEVAARWAEARYEAAVASLQFQAALRLAGERLDRSGIAFVALKGPRLAWECYPEAALRPMRDLDLLVAENHALRAAEALSEVGFTMAAGEAAIAEALRDDKHLPPLWHAGLGVQIELHHRLTDPQGRHGYRVPQLPTDTALAGNERVMLGGYAVPCPAPLDLLAHLMIHALYGHRLDCGPLVLTDIHFLLAAHPIEPTAFWRMAEEGGWVRGASLLLALTERYGGPQPLTAAERPPEAVLGAAEQALLQDLSERDHGAALADLFAARSPAAFAGALARRLRPDAHVVEGEGGGTALWRFWPLWAWRRSRRLARRLRNPRARADAGSSAALLRWLQG